ncbi:MAG: hypothetical protein FWD76_02395 [Firmicutes bacterium]|nr:hypothetical protein [Bacillota bacterium]
MLNQRQERSRGEILRDVFFAICVFGIHIVYSDYVYWANFGYESDKNNVDIKPPFWGLVLTMRLLLREVAVKTRILGVCVFVAMVLGCLVVSGCVGLVTPNYTIDFFGECKLSFADFPFKAQRVGYNGHIEFSTELSMEQMGQKINAEGVDMSVELFEGPTIQPTMFIKKYKIKIVLFLSHTYSQGLCLA